MLKRLLFGLLLSVSLVAFLPSGAQASPGPWKPTWKPTWVPQAQEVISSAKSALGTQYVYGSANPNVGFDCSGLTMWAWSQAGVHLPHSSTSQYLASRHVRFNNKQPGDLLFFYSPISHVALYIGHGKMIHARHPGPGGQVQITRVAAYGTPVVGVVRPG